jgi:hypothetical protein
VLAGAAAVNTRAILETPESILASPESSGKLETGNRKEGGNWKRSRKPEKKPEIG